MTTKEAVLQRLIDLRLITNRSEGERWLVNEKIPAFGCKTPAQLILEGHTSALLEAIERIAEGGYT